MKRGSSLWHLHRVKALVAAWPNTDAFLEGLDGRRLSGEDVDVVVSRMKDRQEEIDKEVSAIDSEEAAEELPAALTQPLRNAMASAVCVIGFVVGLVLAILSY